MSHGKNGKNGNFLCTMQRFSVIPVGLLYRQFFMSHGKNGKNGNF